MKKLLVMILLFTLQLQAKPVAIPARVTETENLQFDLNGERVGEIEIKRNEMDADFTVKTFGVKAKTVVYKAVEGGDFGSDDFTGLLTFVDNKPYFFVKHFFNRLGHLTVFAPADSTKPACDIPTSGQVSIDLRERGMQKYALITYGLNAGLSQCSFEWVFDVPCKKGKFTCTQVRRPNAEGETANGVSVDVPGSAAPATPAAKPTKKSVKK